MGFEHCEGQAVLYGRSWLLGSATWALKQLTRGSPCLSFPMKMMGACGEVAEAEEGVRGAARNGTGLGS